MILDGEHIHNAMIKYLEKYNSEINYNKDVTMAIDEIKNKKAKIVKYKYTELEGYKLLISLLDSYYERTKSDCIGAFLGEMDLIEDYVSMDPAAW